jgi:hypothetical protein
MNLGHEPDSANARESESRVGMDNERLRVMKGRGILVKSIIGARYKYTLGLPHSTIAVFRRSSTVAGQVHRFAAIMKLPLVVTPIVLRALRL